MRFTWEQRSIRFRLLSFYFNKLSPNHGRNFGLASLREKVTLRIVTIDMLVNLVAGLILIRQFGLLGAAITTLLTGLVDCFQHYAAVSKLFTRIALGRLVWKPSVAGLCIAVYLGIVHRQGILRAILASAVLYTGVWLVLVVLVHGGLRQLRVRYQDSWLRVALPQPAEQQD